MPGRQKRDTNPRRPVVARIEDGRPATSVQSRRQPRYLARLDSMPETGGFASPSYNGFALVSVNSRTLGRTSCKLSRHTDVCNRRRCEPRFTTGHSCLTAVAVKCTAAILAACAVTNIGV